MSTCFTKNLSPTGGSGGNPLETLNYEYNIRGWMLGMNRDYAKDAHNNNWFGFDLGYDKAANGLINNQTYSNPQYNGNIEGTVWKSKGDGEKRKYDFAYDAANRLLKADFSQYTGSSFNQNAGVNFNVTMGDGADPASAYDQNGNIKRMQQWGLKIGSSSQIDDLEYSYPSFSNRLLSVTEHSDPNTKLGDFKDGSNTVTDDYDYDDNGNLNLDQNKSISSITYHLNLPSVITVTGKGTITYTYNASGVKQKKTTVDNTVNPTKTTTTLYIGGAVFENDVLQFVAHEKGRTRFKTSNNTLHYDYFLKDHLGNVRMVLTEEQQTDAYPPASMELAQSTTEEAFYSNLSATREDKPSGYPTDTYTNPNDKVAKVRGDGNKIGPAMVLKVMAGDAFNLRVSSWYKLNGSTPNSPSPITTLAQALAGAVAGVSGGKVTEAELTSSGLPGSAATSFLNSQSYNSARPKAFINWIFLDEQFKYYASGFEQVGTDQEFKVHLYNGVIISKSGYLYVYVSNETPNIDVFFDNLQVTHVRGAFLEETHYYPFGLTMAGISSKAAGSFENKRKFNDGTELNETFDIYVYETNFRSLDPQLGRFWQIDPLADAAYENSPFAYSNNNPLTFNDPLGLCSDSTGTPGFSPDNPKILETVTVTSKPIVGSQFLPYIRFPNGRPGTVASYKDWPLSLSRDRRNDLLDSWAMGLGAENRIYLPNHPMTKRLQNAYRINLARAYFYKKYLKNYKNGQSLKGASVTNYQGSFGLLGLVMAGTDLVEQFVGSFTVEIRVDDKGENLLFFVSNTTSNTSAFYHLADSHDRTPGQLTPRGNMHQVFIWQEPISSSGFINIISPRPPAASPTTGIPGSPFL